MSAGFWGRLLDSHRERARDRRRAHGDRARRSLGDGSRTNGRRSARQINAERLAVRAEETDSVGAHKNSSSLRIGELDRIGAERRRAAPFNGRRVSTFKHRTDALFAVASGENRQERKKTQTEAVRTRVHRRFDGRVEWRIHAPERN